MNHQNCEHCPSKDLGIFCNLNHDLKDDLNYQKVSNNFKKGQSLFVQGNPPFGVYCVKKGNVKITQVGDDGKESILRIVGAGDILGLRNLFTDQYYSASATALDQCEVCFIDKKFILKLIQEDPKVGENVIQKLSKELGAAERKISSFYQKNVRERLAELLLLLKESHGRSDNKGLYIDIKLTREEMASIIGTASETLIRFLSELKQEKLISQDGKRIYIEDERGLLDFAGILY